MSTEWALEVVFKQVESASLHGAGGTTNRNIQNATGLLPGQVNGALRKLSNQGRIVSVIDPANRRRAQMWTLPN